MAAPAWKGQQRGVPYQQGEQPKQSQQRRTIDYSGLVMNLLQHRITSRGPEDGGFISPTPAGLLEMLPPMGYPESPEVSLCTKLVHMSTSKRRCPVNVVTWTPDGRRLVTAAQNGEFTIWNGSTFNFESAVSGHDGNSIRCMTYNNNEDWFISGDDSGNVKYWMSSFNFVKAVSAHRESVRALSFAPTDLKFASCSDDTFVKVWDFKRAVAEQTLMGHGSDVKSLHWHPAKGLLASGSKDQSARLWDPKGNKCVATIHGHKNTVSCVQWNNNGNWLLTGSRDQLCKVFDLRNLKSPLVICKGQQRDITQVRWHPHHCDHFVSASADGALCHWVIGGDASATPTVEVRDAHEGPVWGLSFHPLGHMLASGSSDCSAKFWVRARPGEVPQDTGSRPGMEVPGDPRTAHAALPPSAPASHNAIPAEASNIPGVGAASRPPTATLPFSGGYHSNQPGAHSLHSDPMSRKRHHGSSEDMHSQQRPPMRRGSAEDLRSQQQRSQPPYHSGGGGSGGPHPQPGGPFPPPPHLANPHRGQGSMGPPSMGPQQHGMGPGFGPSGDMIAGPQGQQMSQLLQGLITSGFGYEGNSNNAGGPGFQQQQHFVNEQQLNRGPHRPGSGEGRGYGPHRGRGRGGRFHGNKHHQRR